jgi:hypothetical protein
MFNAARYLVVFVFVMIVTGCAEYPSSSSSSSGGMLNITMSVEGTINPNYFYFVVFNNVNDSHAVNGPDPVIAPPYGNGFVAGAATSYVEYSQTLPGDGYLFYRFPNSTLTQPTAIGAPPQDTPVPSGGNTIQFQIPISDLATSNVSASETNYIQVNFLTTNRIPVNPEDTSPKEFDALGNTSLVNELNDYITIPVSQSNTYSSASTGDEPAGDEQVTNGSGGYSSVNDPDVDISGWTIQVTR